MTEGRSWYVEFTCLFSCSFGSLVPQVLLGSLDPMPVCYPAFSGRGQLRGNCGNHGIRGNFAFPIKPNIHLPL